jgi:hypothetical protein
MIERSLQFHYHLGHGPDAHPHITNGGEQYFGGGFLRDCFDKGYNVSVERLGLYREIQEDFEDLADLIRTPERGDRHKKAL